MEHHVGINEENTKNLISQEVIPYSCKKTNIIENVSVESSEVCTLVRPDKDVWESCCFKLNPHGVAYFGQFTVSIMVLGICTFMLVKADGDCNKSSPYIGLVSFLLGKILSTVVSSA